MLRPLDGALRKLYIETYGCQMNVADTGVVVSILSSEGYVHTKEISEADVILVNTCSVRDNAEQRVRGRLGEFGRYKKIKPGLIVGVIGCMAERLKEELVEQEKMVDIVVGPDSYRELPVLLRTAAAGMRGINVELSKEETYAEISPVRTESGGVTAFVSIMRGCNNMCSYCVVPYTRGRERSRDPESVLREVQQLYNDGYREVTLLGQNVNSYRWNQAQPIGFPQLLDMVATLVPQMRIRFATSHPKDLSDQLLETMASHPNICRAIHLPAQSGSTRMLEVMNRRYTREWYLDRIAAVRRYLPECAISTDLIAGFCSETEEDHLQTLSLMEQVGYEFAFMFKYSERPGTKAAESMADDVAEQVKTRRLNEIIELQNRLSLESNQRDVGKVFEVLVEGVSKKRKDQLSGRTSQNKMVVFTSAGQQPGDYVNVRITSCSSATLMGETAD